VHEFTVKSCTAPIFAMSRLLVASVYDQHTEEVLRQTADGQNIDLLFYCGRYMRDLCLLLCKPFPYRSSCSAIDLRPSCLPPRLKATPASIMRSSVIRSRIRTHPASRFPGPVNQPYLLRYVGDNEPSDCRHNASSTPTQYLLRRVIVEIIRIAALHSAQAG